MYRRERGVCRICWTEQDETIDFQLSGGSAAGGMYKLEMQIFFPVFWDIRYYLTSGQGYLII